MSEQRLAAVEHKLDSIDVQVGRLCSSLDRFTETMIRHDENNATIVKTLDDHENRLRTVEREQIGNSGKIGFVWSIIMRVSGGIALAAVVGGIAYKAVS
ncbi:MAG: hypothetical protein Tp138OMZ00d2C19078241_12 [Prokaryotic dsDNA virus sp.]|nr:MAG: hypothetical protein Tp138OMZ00d2C19078241_12 [Prokaryotic dsDNA virus sp.]|tara:strand:- start:29066 stop:29362 length:297 start_codon:yes stop_codon:yes gene_type:complete